jgi:hypothetical protein
MVKGRTKKRSTTMNNQNRKVLASMLLAALAAPFASVFAQGNLMPPGAPAPTMKTLDQIEPRTPISASTAITQSGSYYLTTNITVSSGSGITINADDVSLDLNGFTIHSTAPSATGYGILFNGRRNISIHGGYVTGGVTNNGSGVFSGPGFAYGVYGASALNVTVVNISVEGCRLDGIYVPADSCVVDACNVHTAGSYGINGGAIKASVAEDCGYIAISGDQISDCRGLSVGSHGIAANIVNNSYGYGSSDGISAYTVNNSYGYGTSHGINATTVNNSYGLGTYYGISASSSVNNSYGRAFRNGSGSARGIFASSGTVQNSYGDCGGDGAGDGFAIEAQTVSNCRGYSTRSTIGSRGIWAYKTVENSVGLCPSGTAIETQTASGCFGESNDGHGIWATKTALNCYGKSVSNFGIHTTSANTCTGEGTRGIDAITVEGCHGTGSTAYGIAAATVQNSYGTSTGGYGIWATKTALNCYGKSVSSYGINTISANTCFGEGTRGIHASIAEGCWGKGSTDYGVYASAVQNSIGISTSGTGMFGFNALNSYGSTTSGSYGLNVSSAIGCQGWNFGSGIGIDGTFLNTCYGYSSSGTAVSALHKYNMP